MFLVFVRDREKCRILEVDALDTHDKTVDEIADWATKTVFLLERRYPEEQYEIVSGSAESLERFLLTFAEYRPLGFVKT